jgi:hypothetical protein
MANVELPAAVGDQGRTASGVPITDELMTLGVGVVLTPQVDREVFEHLAARSGSRVGWT